MFDSFCIKFLLFFLFLILPSAPSPPFLFITLLPGVAMELRLLRDKISELEASEKTLKEDAQARHFSVESATGEALLNKCRKLQQENEALAKRLGEGGKEVGVEEGLKAQVGELQRKLRESQARVETLDEERGLITTMVYALRKQLAAASSASAMMAGGGGGEEEGGEGMEVGAE